jgi:hypothetical protein
VTGWPTTAVAVAVNEVTLDAGLTSSAAWAEERRVAVSPE